MKSLGISALEIVIFFIFISANNVYGGAFDNTAIGMRGISMGNALTGIVDDASAIYYNPAGLSFNEKGVWYSSTYVYFTHSSFQYKANAIHDESNEIFIVPGFFLSKTFDKWAFGYGFFVPYAGGGTVYQNFQKTNYDLECSAAFAAATLSTACRLRSNLSLGVSVSLYYGGMEQDFFDPNLGSRIVSEYDGISGYGGYIGLMYKINDAWSMGFTARSDISIEMDGEYEIAGIKYDSDIEMNFPYSFDFGFGYSPDPKFTIAMSVSYRLWGNMDEIKVKIKGLPDNDIDTFYKDSWVAGIGIEYWIRNDFALKAGLKYVQSATKDKGLAPGTVDVDQWNPTAGFAYVLSDSTELNASTMFTYGPREEYHGQTFEMGHWSLILGARFRL